MTGYKSKRAAAQDKLVVTDIDGHVVRDVRKPKKAAAQEPKLQKKDRKRGSIALARSLCYQINGAADDSDDMDGGGYGSVDIAEILSAEVVRLQAALAQPEQEPKSVTYKEVADAMNAMTKGTSGQQIAAEKLGKLKLYTTPPQRPWVDLTPQNLNEIFAIARTGEHAVRLALDKIKEKNNGT